MNFTSHDPNQVSLSDHVINASISDIISYQCTSFTPVGSATRRQYHAVKDIYSLRSVLFGCIVFQSHGHVSIGLLTQHSNPTTSCSMDSHSPAASIDESDSSVESTRDLDYVKPSQAASSIITTPTQRRAYGESCSIQAKQCANAITKGLTNGCCVITNMPPAYGVEYAHVLPRSTDNKTVRFTLLLFNVRYV